MHSHLGRCFTYNFSADGYTRGEARVSGMFRSRSIWPFSRVPDQSEVHPWRDAFFDAQLGVFKIFGPNFFIQTTQVDLQISEVSIQSTWRPGHRLDGFEAEGFWKAPFRNYSLLFFFVAGVRSQEGKPKVGLLLEKLVEKLKVASFFFCWDKIWMIWSFVDLKIGWMGLKWMSVYRFNVLGFLGGVFRGRG